jgi:hypothetical protein
VACAFVDIAALNELFQVVAPNGERALIGS